MADLAVLNTLRSMLEGIRDETRTYSNTATRIGNAFLALLQYLLDGPFLRKDQEDSTAYLVKLLAGAVIGEGKIRLNPDGSISCGRITVEGSAIFNELVFNHQNVLEGDTYFTDRGIIDRLEWQTDGRVRLFFRKMYDDDVTTFHVNDIIKCSMNNLDTAKTYSNCFLRADSIDTATNSALCTLYDDSDVPGGRNYTPKVSARCIRWGNAVDESRQSCFFVNAQDGTFLFLQGVDKPILTDANHAAFIGLPPELECFRDLPLNRHQPYVYAKGLIVEDIIRIDYQGNPHYTARDRGQWKPDVTYIKGFDDTWKGYYVDRVWWKGCLWQCAVASCTGSEPRFNNTDWVCLIGGENMSISIISSNGDAFPAGSRWTTTLNAHVFNAEMELTESEISRSNIVWSRLSDDSAGDTAWNIRHQRGTVGLSLDIDSSEDISGQWTVGSKVAFICTIYIQGQSYTNEYSILM